jgi:hypothetical protein
MTQDTRITPKLEPLFSNDPKALAFSWIGQSVDDLRTAYDRFNRSRDTFFETHEKIHNSKLPPEEFAKSLNMNGVALAHLRFDTRSCYLFGRISVLTLDRAFKWLERRTKTDIVSQWKSAVQRILADLDRSLTVYRDSIAHPAPVLPVFNVSPAKKSVRMMGYSGNLTSGDVQKFMTWQKTIGATNPDVASKENEQLYDWFSSNLDAIPDQYWDEARTIFNRAGVPSGNVDDLLHKLAKLQTKSMRILESLV